MMIIPYTFAALAIYGAIFVVVMRRTKGRWRWLAAAVMLFLPFWDQIPSRLYFSHLCANESGVTLQRPVRVSGFSPRFLSEKDAIRYLDAGYSFVERRETSGDVVRYRKDANAKIVKEIDRSFLSDYELVYGAEDLPLGMQKESWMVRNRSSLQAAYAYSVITYWGNWWFRLAGDAMSGPARVCPAVTASMSDDTHIRAALVPISTP